jgi:hypothetical protein
VGGVTKPRRVSISASTNIYSFSNRCKVALLSPFKAEADRVARIDSALEARVVQRTSLAYLNAAVDEEDRPAHVRAASGICFAGGQLVVVQDDASFLAMLTPREKAQHVPLPAGPGGRRRFEKRLGNKNDKLDLESAFAFQGRVFAMGSGSLPLRERIVVFDPAEPDGAAIIDATLLYGALHADARFSGGALNIEGAAVLGHELCLFQRGNGEGESLAPAMATLDVQKFISWIDNGGDVPVVTRVLRFDLGSIDGVRLGFTDACGFDGAVYFLASAEGSPNTVDDGDVTGSCLGVLRGEEARITPLIDEHGKAAPLKAEGIAIDPGDPTRAWVVLDGDDPDVASDLCEVRLRGPW